MPIKDLLFLLVFTVCCVQVNGQKNEESDTSDINTFLLPIVYYTPETTWSFGGAGVMTFSLDESSPRSQLQLGLAYTLRNQVLVYLPFQLFMKDDKLRFSGELGYYKYNYFFYGVGNDFEDYEGELYGVDYPRVRINALYRIGKHQFAGLKYSMDDWTVYDQAVDGLLSNEDITGSNGSLYSAIGPIWQLDSRDHVFFPTEGFWIESSLLWSHSSLGASQDFIKAVVDMRKYWGFGDDKVLAGQLYLEGNTGTPPFNQLAFLGGTKIMRGYYEGRYRDRQMAVTQWEYRFPIKKRLGAVAFLGIGTVVDKWANWQADFLRYTVGAGLRYDLIPEDRIRMRLDFGVGKGSSAFYLTVGEAF